MTPDGIGVWETFRRCNGQLRWSIAPIGGDGPAIARICHGLDFASVLAFAEGLGTKTPLFLDLLPEIEAIAVRKAMETD